MLLSRLGTDVGGHPSHVLPHCPRPRPSVLALTPLPSPHRPRLPPSPPHSLRPASQPAQLARHPLPLPPLRRPARPANSRFPAPCRSHTGRRKAPSLRHPSPHEPALRPYRSDARSHVRFPPVHGSDAESYPPAASLRRRISPNRMLPLCSETKWTARPLRRLYCSHSRPQPRSTHRRHRPPRARNTSNENESAHSAR